MMRLRGSRLISAAIVAVGALAGPAAASSQASPVSYFGSAYGTAVSAAGHVVSGQSAAAGLGCTTTPGPRADNTLAALTVGGLLSTGALDTDSVSSSDRVVSTGDAADVHLLSGLISATTVKAVSTTKATGTGFQLSGAGSRLYGLTVAGVPIGLSPSANTTIPLPGIGRVVLNQQIRSVNSQGAGLTVNVIHVYLTARTQGFPAGTQIIVGSAYSALTRTAVPASLIGGSYATTAQIGGVLNSGPTWEAGMCAGTGGALSENAMIGLDLPGVVSAGALLDTARGTVGTNATYGETTSTIHGLDLLSGLITASVVRADVHLNQSGGQVTLGDRGTTFAQLTVAGRTILDVSRNTEIHLPGIDIYLKHETRTQRRIDLTMIEVVVSGANAYGLPAGSDVRVAGASLGV